MTPDKNKSVVPVSIRGGFIHGRAVKAARLGEEVQATKESGEEVRTRQIHVFFEGGEEEIFLGFNLKGWKRNV